MIGAVNAPPRPWARTSASCCRECTASRPWPNGGCFPPTKARCTSSTCLVTWPSSASGSTVAAHAAAVWSSTGCSNWPSATTQSVTSSSLRPPSRRRSGLPLPETETTRLAWTAPAPDDPGATRPDEAKSAQMDSPDLDNGSAMISKQLMRALAVLGIQLIHSKPREPAGRGKIERVFRTVREQFLIELAVPGALAKIATLAQLNELFTAWVETVYHQRVHSETGQTPLARFTTADPPVIPTPAALHEAFLWSETRLVAKTATVSLFGNTYEVDAALVGRRVELVFDPFDLSDLQVRYQGRDMGVALG